MIEFFIIATHESRRSVKGRTDHSLRWLEGSYKIAVFLEKGLEVTSYIKDHVICKCFRRDANKFYCSKLRKKRLYFKIYYFKVTLGGFLKNPSHPSHSSYSFTLKICKLFERMFQLLMLNSY